jgi:hypothetical protein
VEPGEASDSQICLNAIAEMVEAAGIEPGSEPPKPSEDKDTEE